MSAVCSVICGHADRQKGQAEKRAGGSWSCPGGVTTAGVGGATAPESHYTAKEVGPGLLTLAFISLLTSAFLSSNHVLGYVLETGL